MSAERALPVAPVLLGEAGLRRIPEEVAALPARVAGAAEQQPGEQAAVVSQRTVLAAVLAGLVALAGLVGLRRPVASHEDLSSAR